MAQELTALGKLIAAYKFAADEQRKLFAKESVPDKQQPHFTFKCKGCKRKLTATYVMSHYVVTNAADAKESVPTKDENRPFTQRLF
jgi:hypothetical protein